MSLPKISIIIAVYSELESLNQTIILLKQGFAEIDIEIIIVAHPDSTTVCLDNCQTLAQTHSYIHFLVQKQTPGQGYAYREAIAESQGSYILLMNADLETHPPDARILYDTIIQRHCDLVVASRWCKGAVFDAVSYGRIKLAGNYTFQRIFSLLFHTHVTDLTFCYKIARAGIFKSLQWRGTQHEFALETTLVPIALGMDVREIPTQWYGRREGASHFKFYRNIRNIKLAIIIIMMMMIQRLETVYVRA